MQMQNFVNWNLSFVRKVGKSNHSPCKLTLKAFKLLTSDLKRFKPKTRSTYIVSGKNDRTTFTYQNFHQLYIYMHKAYFSNSH